MKDVVPKATEPSNKVDKKVANKKVKHEPLIQFLNKEFPSENLP